MNDSMNLASHYLEKHAVPPGKFGLGPFLDTGFYGLRATDRTHIRGNMELVVISGRYWDCATIADEMRHDIQIHTPELKPRVMHFNDNDKGTHFWVEIEDPNTHELIQLDGTPWYNCLNPGHVGKEMNGTIGSNLPVMPNRGLPLSVSLLGEKQVTAYLYGVLPNASVEERILDLEAGVRKKVQKPDYRFEIRVGIGTGFGNKPEDVIGIRIEIPDSGKLQQFLQITQNLNELVRLGVVQISIDLYGMYIPVQDLKIARIIATKLKAAELFREIEKNIERLVKLLQLATPNISTPSGRIFDVRTGIEGFGTSLAIERLGGIPKQKDEITTEKYIGFLIGTIQRSSKKQPENLIRMVR